MNSSNAYLALLPRPPAIADVVQGAFVRPGLTWPGETESRRYLLRSCMKSPSAIDFFFVIYGSITCVSLAIKRMSLKINFVIFCYFFVIFIGVYGYYFIFFAFNE